MHKILLGLGGNMGGKTRALSRAVRVLSEHLTITAVSPVYRSRSLLDDGQDAYCNCVVAGLTFETPMVLLSKMKEIETALGRVRGKRWGERLIDIDILDYDGTVFHSDELEIPHPRMHERSFVLLPLLDILPHWQHPQTGESGETLIAQLGDDLGIVRIGRLAWRLSRFPVRMGAGENT